MWLLDANLPLKLVGVLKSLGVQSETAEARGWKTLKNGELVKAAHDAGFRCILTKDLAFGESAAKALRQFPDMAVVILRLFQMREQAYLAAFLDHWKRQPIAPVAGQLCYWP